MTTVRFDTIQSEINKLTNKLQKISELYQKAFKLDGELSAINTRLNEVKTAEDVDALKTEYTENGERLALLFQEIETSDISAIEEKEIPAIEEMASKCGSLYQKDLEKLITIAKDLLTEIKMTKEKSADIVNNLEICGENITLVEKKISEKKKYTPTLYKQAPKPVIEPKSNCCVIL